MPVVRKQIVPYLTFAGVELWYTPEYTADGIF